MFAQRNFVACIEGQLKERGYGAKRLAGVLDNFHGLTAQYRSQGYGDQISQAMAMNAMFDKIARATREANKRAMKQIEVQARTISLVDQALEEGRFKSSAFVMDGGKGKGAALVRAAISDLQADPRFSNVSVEEIKQGKRGRYWSMWGDALEKYGKGAFGSQKGKAGLYDIIREMYQPGSTGNVDAQHAADSFLILNKVMVDDRNESGGTLNFLDNYVPQRKNSVKVNNVSFDTFAQAEGARWDWDRMTWGDGSPIAPADRPSALRAVYDTWTTNGSNKIDPTAFNGRGSSIGNQIDNHRFVHYKDAEGWIASHEQFGDGNVFDVLSHTIEGMAHQSALIDKFGPTPAAWFENVQNIIMSRAQAVVRNAAPGSADKQALAVAEKVIKNRLQPMWETYTRANPMDPQGWIAASAVAISNVLTSAKLGSVPLLAVAGDFHQTLSVRLLNNMPINSGMDTYLKGVTAFYKDTEALGLRSGYVFDTMVGSKIMTERFSPVATYGPAISNRISDVMLRASGLTRHTEIARFTAQHEFMGLLHDHTQTAFDDLPFKRVLERYGIDAGNWDAVRKNITPWQPQQGANFMRPLDILDTSLADKRSLYQKFYAMVNTEAKYMVPGATLEAGTMLRGTTRPDSTVGIILHSFAMYKNFPLTFAQTYGRLALAGGDGSRLGYMAAIGLGSVMVGAMGVQLRELTKGREPIPMNRAAFWGKAVLAGGGMSLWGDYLFNGINEIGQTPASALAGPLLGFGNDSINLALGDPFKFVAAYDKGDAMDYKSPFGARLAHFAKMNAPGTSLWYARLALERAVWDKLENVTDPDVYKKRKQREAKQLKDYGNKYWSPPGSGFTGVRQ